MSFFDAIKKRRLTLDGAMGTMIQRYKLEEEDYRGDQFKNHDVLLKGNNDLLSITKPEIIKEIYREYLSAGADIIETNTFSSTRIAQADYSLEEVIYELNYQSAKIAKETTAEFTDKERYVAGSLGPMNKTASMSPDVNDPSYRAVTFDELKEAYKEQATALFEGGVDCFLIETIFDTLNSKAALFAIDELLEEKSEKRPILVSGTIVDASGRTLSGQTVDAFYTSLMHFDITAIGLNCSLGAKQLLSYLKELNKVSDIPLLVYPNAGLPNELGEYDQSPEEMQDELKDYLEIETIRIFGGCCGTTPPHIKAIHDLVSKT